MTFYVEYETSYMAFTGDFICSADNACQDAGVFKLRIYLPDGSNNTYFVRGRSFDIFSFARNDIIHIVETKDKFENEFIFELQAAWKSKYMKYGNSEEREKFIRENINLPMKFIDSVEESEAIIDSVNEVLKLWENRSYKNGIE